MKTILTILVFVLCGVSFAQMSLHLQAGYYAPQVNLKNEIINGPIVSAGIVLGEVYQSSYFIETKIDYFRNFNRRVVADIYSWSWAIFVPVVSREYYCISPFIGVGLSRFSHRGILWSRGSMSENPQLSAGGNLGLLIIVRSITLQGEYNVREVNGLAAPFKIGGMSLMLGYLIEL